MSFLIVLVGMITLATIVQQLRFPASHRHETTAMMTRDGVVGFGLVLDAGLGWWAARAWVTDRWRWAVFLTLIWYVATALLMQHLPGR